jgi:hypothetical protein
MLKTLDDVSQIIGIDVKKLPGKLSDKKDLIRWTNDLIEEKGVDWVKKNRMRLLNRWEMIYSNW